jgi:aspartate carbamoyltransferase regulatory subunit
MMKELKVSAIKDGSVLDHIPSLSTFKVVKILGLEGYDNVVTVASNLKSKKMGKKGIIKIGGKRITEKEANAIAVVAPKAVLNIIKDYKVVLKVNLSIPDSLKNIVKCSNPECITNYNNIETKFKVLDKKKMLIRCHYCERIMQDNEIVIKS